MSPLRIAGSMLVALLFSAGSALASPAPEPPQRIPASQLQTDFAVMKRALEELHPGLYRYNTREQMEARFAELRAAMSRDLTLPEAYLAISTFLAKIQCGHTYPNFFNQPKAVVAALFQGPRVPFYFRWLDRRMIVTRDLSAEKSLKPGTEILSLQGVPVGTVLDRLLTISRSDGANEAKRIRNLEVRGDGEYEAFDVYFPLFFPPPGDRMELRVRGPLTGEEKTLTVRPLSHEERLAVQPEDMGKAPEGNDPAPWTFKYLEPQVAYLRMPTWVMYKTKWNWQGFLQETFDELARRKTPSLILDLRGNEGGSSVGDEILRHLIRKEMPARLSERRVRYRKAPEDLVPYLDTWDPSFKDWRDEAIDLRNGFYRFADEDRILKPLEPRFEGRLLVLVDAVNSSATFEFAEAVQSKGLGTLIGQPTGGNRRGINGGAFFFLRLPNSKIEVDLPLIGYFPPGELPNAGLLPEVLVEPSPDDIARGIDTELARALELTRSGKL